MFDMRSANTGPRPWLVIAAALAVGGCGRGEVPTSEPASDASASTATVIERAEALARDLAPGSAGVSALERIERSLDGLSSQGGEAVLLVDRDVLRRASVTLYGEIGRVVLEYYLDGRGQPVLVTRSTVEYDQPFGDVALETRERIYLENDRIGHWVVDGVAQVERSAADRAETEAAIRTVLERVIGVPRAP